MTQYWQTTVQVARRMAMLLFIMIPLCFLFSWLLSGVFSAIVVDVVSVVTSYLLAKFVLFTLNFERVEKEVKQEVGNDKTEDNKD